MNIGKYYILIDDGEIALYNYVGLLSNLGKFAIL